MNVLAVGAHWDDVELGCALTLRRLRERGANLYGAVLTDSKTSMPGHERGAETAAAEGLAAFQSLGMEPVSIGWLTCEQGFLQYDTQIMRLLERLAASRSVDVVFAHWPGDVNTDHRAAWEISRAAFRHVPTLLCYASNGYTDGAAAFRPNLFMPFSAAEYEAKTGLLRLHATEWEFRAERWRREIFDRESTWGSQCGADYAEGFMAMRMRDPWSELS